MRSNDVQLRPTSSLLPVSPLPLTTSNSGSESPVERLCWSRTSTDLTLGSRRKTDVARVEPLPASPLPTHPARPSLSFRPDRHAGVLSLHSLPGRIRYSDLPRPTCPLRPSSRSTPCLRQDGPHPSFVLLPSLLAHKAVPLLGVARRARQDRPSPQTDSRPVASRSPTPCLLSFSSCWARGRRSSVLDKGFSSPTFDGPVLARVGHQEPASQASPSDAPAAVLSSVKATARRPSKIRLPSQPRLSHDSYRPSKVKGQGTDLALRSASLSRVERGGARLGQGGARRGRRVAGSRECAERTVR